MTYVESFSATDPELAGYLGRFLHDDVERHGSLAPRNRALVRLGALVATASSDAYRALLDDALDGDVTPVEAKEVVYQAVPYVGLGRALPFVAATNDALRARGVELPLPGQSTTTPETRAADGRAVQERIVGADRVAAMYANAPADEQHVQRWLSANCFGDHYTRGGLDVATRELLTLAILVALGGADPQVRGHVAANLNVGNDRQALLDVVAQLLPYVGYPRTLNAIAAIDAIVPAGSEEQ